MFLPHIGDGIANVVGWITLGIINGVIAWKQARRDRAGQEDRERVKSTLEVVSSKTDEKLDQLKSLALAMPMLLNGKHGEHLKTIADLTATEALRTKLKVDKDAAEKAMNELQEYHRQIAQSAVVKQELEERNK